MTIPTTNERKPEVSSALARARYIALCALESKSGALISIGKPEDDLVLLTDEGLAYLNHGERSEP